MLALPGELFRAELEQRLSRVKRATQAYVRDRTEQATGMATSYAVATGLFAIAAIFLLGACLVGFMALFRYVELEYGTFPAFGAIGGLLILLAAICAAIAALRMKRPAPSFPSLTSRLNAALASPTAHRAASDDVDPDDVIPQAADGQGRGGTVNIPIALALAALLLGWAAMRRRQR